MALTFEEVRADEAVSAYIRRADEALEARGYTEHSFPHVTRTALTAARILRETGHAEREAELAAIAGYLHDIGNVVNRDGHEHSGALIAFSLLTRMGGDPDDIAAVIAAIGNHDEGTAFPVSAMAAALILADKTDVRHTRVRGKGEGARDIHDRVNSAVRSADLAVDGEQRAVRLHLTIDTAQSPISDYFEIFLSRMLLCRRAAEKLGYLFSLSINGQVMM